MNKTFTILSALYYLLMTTGIFISVHYCHGSFEDIKVYGTYSSDCCESHCGLEERCCSIDSISLKINTEHLYTTTNIQLVPSEIITTDYQPLAPINVGSEQDYPDIINTSPPSIADKFILHCSLTYYG